MEGGMDKQMETKRIEGGREKIKMNGKNGEDREREEDGRQEGRNSEEGRDEREFDYVY